MLSVTETLPESRDELLGIISNLSAKNGELNATNAEQGTIIHRLETQNEQLATRLHWLEEQFHLLRHKRFGKSSERTVPEQLRLFNDAEVIAEHEPAQESDLETITYERKKPGRKPLPADLPRERIEYELPEQEQICPQCKGQMHKIGEDVRSELNIIPAQVKVIEHVRFKYGCRHCEKHSETTPIKTAPAPNPVIRKGYASPSSVAYVMTAKFVDGVPLYRQEKHFERLGLKISRSVLSDWMLKGSQWLEPIYAIAHQALINREVLHVDETTLQVLKEPDRAAETKSYMWLYRTGRDLGSPIILYDYQETRSGAHPRKFLSGFKGYLHADGYSGYDGLEEITEPDKPPNVKLCGCWSHLRRKFDEAMKGQPPGKRHGGRSKEALGRINLLFSIERGLEKSTPEQRLEARQEKSRPVVEELLRWLDSIKGEILPKSLLGTAVTYGLNQWKKLTRFFEDGRVELSNNRAERSIKPFVIGRKNFLFCNTPQGARSSAVIYSIIEMAKENSLNPYAYLTCLFERLPNVDITDASVIETLMPWNIKLTK
jgi:transposase